MARKLKVWGGTDGGRGRVIVAATTKKRAVEVLNKWARVSMYHFNDYWTETGNELELKTATEEGVWKRKGSFKGECTRVV